MGNQLKYAMLTKPRDDWGLNGYCMDTERKGHIGTFSRKQQQDLETEKINKNA